MVEGRVENADGEEDRVQLLLGLVALRVDVDRVDVDEHHDDVEDLHEAADLVEREAVLFPLEVEQLGDRVGREDLELVRLVQQLHKANVRVHVLLRPARLSLPNVEADLR